MGRIGKLDDSWESIRERLEKEIAEEEEQEKGKENKNPQANSGPTSS